MKHLLCARALGSIASPKVSELRAPRPANPTRDKPTFLLLYSQHIINQLIEYVKTMNISMTALIRSYIVRTKFD